MASEERTFSIFSTALGLIIALILGVGVCANRLLPDIKRIREAKRTLIVVYGVVL